MNLRPLGYEPSELPDCSTPQKDASNLPRHPPTCLQPGRYLVGLADGVGVGVALAALATFAARSSACLTSCSANWTSL